MKIGEFAQLGQVSVRMLRHYESMDLLTPDSVDPFTGHRSYTVAQLSLLNRIMALNALGIPLRKIAELLDADVHDFSSVTCRSASSWAVSVRYPQVTSVPCPASE